MTTERTPRSPATNASQDQAPASMAPGLDTGGSDAPMIGDGESTTLYQDGILHILLVTEPFGLRLIGQARLSHRAAIERALRRTERDVADVHLDLTGLESIDVGLARMLVDHAGVLGTEGRVMRLVGLRTGVLRIFQVCLWPQPANLFMDSAGRRDRGNGASGRPASSETGGLPRQRDDVPPDRE